MNQAAAAALAWIAASSSRLWLPSLAFIGAAAWTISSSLRAENFPAHAHAAHDRTLTWLAVACWVAAALLDRLAPLRRWAAEHLDALGRGPARRHAAWIALAYAGLWAWLGFIRYCQYRSYFLPADTAHAVNTCYQFLFHRSFTGSVIGIDMASHHFTPLLPLMSPLLLLGKSPWLLLMAENALVVSAPIAAYCLAFALTSSSMVGAAALVLAASNPYFFELVSANFNYNGLIALLPWAAFFWLRRRWALCALAALLMISTIEQVPLTLLGLSAWAVFALGWRKPRSWAIGAGLACASLALWAFEMSVIAHFARRAGLPAVIKSDFFRHLVPLTAPDDRILAEMALNPWRTLTTAFHSWIVLVPVAKLALSTGLTCLLAPAALLPFAATVVPHLLANPGVSETLVGPIARTANFANFGLHYASPVMGPLLFAACWGLRRLHAWLAPKGEQGWILVGALAIAGFGFKFADRSLIHGWRPGWFDAFPKIVQRIPPKARLWADEYATPPLSTRRWIAMVGWGPGEPMGYDRLFAPDYVLFDSSFPLFGENPYRDRVLTYLSRGGYRKVAEEASLILLASPKPSRTPDDPPERISLPAADPARARAYARQILTRLDGEGTMVDSSLEDQNGRGLAAAAQSRWDEAIRYYEDVLALDPKFYKAHNNLGIALAAIGSFEQAEKHYREAVRLAPKHAGVRVYFGNFLAARDRIEEAAAQFRAALEAEPDNAEARRNLRQVSAVLEARRSATPDEAAAERLNSEGLALAAKGRWAEATELYGAALQSAPGFFKAHNNLGIALAALGRHNEAERHFRTAVSLEPAHAEVRFYYGNFLADRRRLDEAEAQYLRALHIDPRHAGSAENLRRVRAQIEKER